MSNIWQTGLAKMTKIIILVSYFNENSQHKTMSHLIAAFQPMATRVSFLGDKAVRA
jgi:hypothetical protein